MLAQNRFDAHKGRSILTFGSFVHFGTILSNFIKYSKSLLKGSWYCNIVTLTISLYNIKKNDYFEIKWYLFMVNKFTLKSFLLRLVASRGLY